MPSMPVLVLLATIICCLLVLLWTFLRWSMGQGARVLLRGTGAILVLVGLHLAGVMLLAGHGVRSLVEWFQRSTPLGTSALVGLGIAGTGLLFWLVGTLLKSNDRDQARTVRQTRKGVQPAAVAPRGGATADAAAEPAVTGPAPRQAQPVQSSEEDAEIEAILKNRGIE